MGTLQKIQNQPEPARKVILWVIILILAIVMLYFWVRRMEERLKNVEFESIGKNLDLQGLQNELKNVPKFEIKQ